MSTRLQVGLALAVFAVTLCPIGITSASAGPPPDYVVVELDSGALSQSIPDGTGSTLSDLEVTQIGTLVDVDASVRISHPNDGDLRLTLRRPLNGLGMYLVNQQGGSGDNFGEGAMNCGGTMTTFSDEGATAITSASPPYAGTYKPVASGMDTYFNSEPPNGLWQLRLQDLVAGNAGILHCFKLRLIIDTDTDDDGYSDEKEMKLGTDPNDASDPVEHERTILLNLRKHLRAKGSVAADVPFGPCTKGVQVKIQKQLTVSDWDTVAKPRTNQRRRYSKKITDAPDLYRAVVPKKNVTKNGILHICPAAFSQYKSLVHN
jgi:subtilisin-like proprotein convertase family protein